MTLASLHPHAALAVRAAHLRYAKNVGRFASWRFAQKRGCPLRIYTLACQLHALTSAGVAP